MKNDDLMSRGKFSLSKNLVYQQDLAVQLEDYLKAYHPDLARDFDEIFPRPKGSKKTLGERMAIRCCLPLTMHRYLQAAGSLTGVRPMEYINKMWDAFGLSGVKNWSRPMLTQLTRLEYGVPIISCGVRWLNEPFDEESRHRMIKSGYCGSDKQVDQYLELLYGKTPEQIIKSSPVVLTIKSPKGTEVAHSVIAWDIEEDELIYSNADERDGGRVQLTKAPLRILASNETRIGAITILT